MVCLKNSSHKKENPVIIHSRLNLVKPYELLEKVLATVFSIMKVKDWPKIQKHSKSILKVVLMTHAVYFKFSEITR